MRLLAAQLLQLLALLALAAAAWLVQLGTLDTTTFRLALVVASALLVHCERLAPPPGGFLSRVFYRPRRLDFSSICILRVLRFSAVKPPSIMGSPVRA